MKNRIIFILFLISFFSSFTSCSEHIAVIARILNIDSTDSKLELHFEFKRMSRNEFSDVNKISIYRGDSLMCILSSQISNGISEWTFPSIPDNFKIDYPENVNKIPTTLKDQNIKFKFDNESKYPGFGYWIYKTLYTDKKYRWLFDKTGNQRTSIDCFYEPWLGKDIVKIELSENIRVIDSTFNLTHITGEPIDFKIKYKRNPTDEIALILNKSIKTDNKILLRFKIDSVRGYEEIITVPDKSIIGIAGKYSDL